METTWLRSFVALGHHLHFGRAAASLHLSQSALSVQIKRLEEHLGVSLFHRNRHAVTLTFTGKHFLVDVKRLLREMERVEAAAREYDSGARGHLRLAFVSTGATHFVPGIVRQYREKYLNIELTLQNLRTSDQVRALLRNDIDIGIARLPLTDDKIGVTLIATEPFCCFLPQKHPLAEQQAIDIRTLKGEPFFLYDRSRAPEFSDSILRMCLEAGFSPAVTQNAGEMQTILSMVSAGMGVSILPASAANLGISDVAVLPLLGDLPRAELGLVMLRTRTHEKLVHRFAGELHAMTNHLRQLPD